MLNEYLQSDWRAAAARWNCSKPEQLEALRKARIGESADSVDRQIAAHQRERKLAPALAVEALAAKSASLDQWLAIGEERVIGKANFEPGTFFEVGLAVGRAVCLIDVRNALGTTLWRGTGFMVSPTVMITNNHVLKAAEHAANAFITFDYRIDPYGQAMPTTVFKLDPATFFFTDKDCDCTLVAVGKRVSGQLEAQDFGWLPLVGTEGKIKIGDPVNIIQHPSGEPMQWVVRENNLLALPDFPGARDPHQFAHYEADTMPGSSGAPAMSRMWEVIALHHQAVPATNAAGDVLDVNGDPYFGNDESRVKWIGNEGVRVSALVRLFKANASSLSGAAARAMASVLEAERPDHVALALKARGPVARRDSEFMPDRLPQPAIGAGQRIELTIPLHVTITVGAPQFTAPAQAGPPASVAIAARPQVVSKPASAALSERAIALKEFEKSVTRTYLDQDRMAKDCEKYYGLLSPGADAAVNFEDLSDLLKQTHKNKPKYKPASQLYPWIDLHQHQGELVIKSIYSGEINDARKFINEAFDLAEAREREQDEMSFREAGPGMDEAAFDEYLEREFPYNCEHVVPQSWFGKREPMRGDLHHLFACETRCNSFRGNHAFFSFEEVEASMDACGRQESHRFEPLAGKGAVARATLYFLVRYPGMIDLDRSMMDGERIDMLRRWHEEDLVSAYEQHRNQAIFEVQGNRNPFIDHPDWVSRMAFELGLTRHGEAADMPAELISVTLSEVV